MMLDQKGEPKSGGVYTWRSVEAETQEEAIGRAREKLLSDEALTSEMWNRPEEPLEVEVDEVNLLPDTADVDQADSGCVFYFDDEDALPLGTIINENHTEEDK